MWEGEHNFINLVQNGDFFSKFCGFCRYFSCIAISIKTWSKNQSDTLQKKERTPTNPEKNRKCLNGKDSYWRRASSGNPLRTTRAPFQNLNSQVGHIFTRNKSSRRVYTLKQERKTFIRSEAVTMSRMIWLTKDKKHVPFIWDSPNCNNFVIS